MAGRWEGVVPEAGDRTLWWPLWRRVRMRAASHTQLCIRRPLQAPTDPGRTGRGGGANADYCLIWRWGDWGLGPGIQTPGQLMFMVSVPLPLCWYSWTPPDTAWELTCPSDVELTSVPCSVSVPGESRVSRQDDKWLLSSPSWGLSPLRPKEWFMADPSLSAQEPVQIRGEDTQPVVCSLQDDVDKTQALFLIKG